VQIIMTYDRDMIADMMSVLKPEDVDGLAIDGDALALSGALR
jgi:hypothetical protein